MESSNLLPAASAGLTVVVGLLPSAMVPGTKMEFFEVADEQSAGRMAVPVSTKRTPNGSSSKAQVLKLMKPSELTLVIWELRTDCQAGPHCHFSSLAWNP